MFTVSLPRRHTIETHYSSAQLQLGAPGLRLLCWDEPLYDVTRFWEGLPPSDGLPPASVSP